MYASATWKIGQHSAAGLDSRIAEFGVFGDAPNGQEPAHNDAAVEKICVGRFRFAIERRLERKGGKPRVPRIASQKSRRAEARFQVSGVSRPPMEKHQSAHRVAGDLGGYAGVLAEVRSIVSRHAPACFLDSRLQEPAAGRIHQPVGR